MEMTNERLREIRRQVRDTVREDEQEDIWELANELIVAVEQTQIQPETRLSHEKAKDSETIRALRKQLAFCEQQARVYLEQHEKLRELLETKDKQLIEVQAEVAEHDRIDEATAWQWHDLKVELVEAHKLSDKIGVSCDKLLQNNNDLRVELDRAQHEIAIWENIDMTWSMTSLCQIVDERNDLRKQLAEMKKLSRDWQHEYFEAKAELKSNQYTMRQIPDLCKQLAEVQAECDDALIEVGRLQDELDK